MTGGIMLIGVWLMIQHQCCAVNQNEKSRNSFLIDQLSRRSSLEKNFMRFGRSLPQIEERKEALARLSRGADFMRFGRPSKAAVIGKRKIQERSGSNDFMRFGRSAYPGDKRLARNSKVGFIRFGRFAENPVNKEKVIANTPLKELEMGEDQRETAGQAGLFRFGRSGFLQSGRFASTGEELERGKQEESGYIRFERSGALEDGGHGIPFTSEMKRGKDTGFLRFGKSSHLDPVEKRLKQGRSAFLRFAPSGFRLPGNLTGKEYEDFFSFGKADSIRPDFTSHPYSFQLPVSHIIKNNQKYFSRFC